MSDKRKNATQRAKAAKLAATPRSPQDLQEAVSAYAVLEMTIESLTLEADAELKAVTERHTAKIEARKAQAAELLPLIEEYTRSHRSELFKGDSKTTEVCGHELSLRTSPPKVDTTPKTTQKAVLAKLIEHEDADFADRFIRWSEALNKEAILEAHDLVSGDWKPGFEELGTLGLVITQNEVFSLKTKRVLGEGKTSTGTAEPA